MEEMRFFVNTSSDNGEALSDEQRAVLERALAKTVILGARVGVGMDQMIQLLEAGMTAGELLEYLLTLANEIA
ncbi:MAG: hypothetical protein ABSG70_07655 [Terriglobales bacterium]|jgi:hypothetical protein